MKTVRISSLGCTRGMSCVERCTKICLTWIPRGLTCCDRFKADMWSRIAEEMAIPWRAAEAMHWQMGENEMARRAGVSPFTLANNNSHAPPPPPPTRTLARHSSDMTPHMRRNSGPPGSIPQLPSLAELTAGIPALTHPPYTSQPVNNHTEYPFPSRQSLPPRPMYDQHPQPNGRRYP